MSVHVIVNITTKQSHYNVYTIIIVLFRRPMWSGQWPGPGPAGSGRASNMKLFCGPGRDIIVAGRAGPGPHNSICRPGPGQVCTTAAGPGRAWTSNHVCGPGLGLDFRPVQGPTVHGSPLATTSTQLGGGGTKGVGLERSFIHHSEHLGQGNQRMRSLSRDYLEKFCQDHEDNRITHNWTPWDEPMMHGISPYLFGILQDTRSKPNVQLAFNRLIITNEGALLIPGQKTRTLILPQIIHASNSERCKLYNYVIWTAHDR